MNKVVRFAMVAICTAVLAVPIRTFAQNWTGDGGTGMSITILTPQAKGLAENQSHLPALIQGEFVSNFSGYSAISVLDWERLDELYLNLMSEKYDDKAREGLDLGNLAHTTHILGGNLVKTPTGYSLRMHITKTSDKTTVASFTGNFTYWDLNNLTAIRQASLELLKKVGVTLTAKAQQELAGAAAENYVTAQNALARGVTAQRQGSEVAALSHYFQAAAFNPSMREAGNRSSILNANITSGNMGDNLRNDIAWRKQWVERLTETERFFENFNKMESMPYTLFYTNDIKQIGEINYQNETVTMGIETYLYGSGIWTVSIERALQAVWDGLNATGRKDVWQLGGWPQRGVTNLKAFERRSKKFSVAFELLNNQNKIIGKQTLQADGYWGLNWSGRPTIEISAPDRKTFRFQNVNANDVTDKMTIRVTGVNGADAEAAAINGVLRIRTITANDVATNDRFRFAKGEIQGFANRNENVTELIIPGVIWGDPVISIGNGAFAENNNLASITIGANLTVGFNAFSGGGVYYFINAYNQNSRRADRYNRRSSGWLSETQESEESERRRQESERRRQESELKLERLKRSAATVIQSIFEFTDPRDGKKYRALKIGNRTWMAENLNFKTGKSWCYGNKESNCQKYGRLYNWDTAMKACPAGWRLPTRQEWSDLVETAGGDVAGTKLKSKSPNWNGTDEFGVSALPGGFRGTDGGFYGAGSSGYWWSATEGGSGNAWRRKMGSNSGYVIELTYDKGIGFSTLCVQE